jgi:homoaconitase/3-isopropylmalate dehydratase large subunit
MVSPVTTFEYIKGRPYAQNFNQSIGEWQKLYSDEDAHFDPYLAPPSIAMLQIVIRPSMDSD